MLDFQRTRIDTSREVKLHSAVSSLEEGVALVSAIEGGVQAAKIATSTATDIFLGVSYSQTSLPTSLVMVEEIAAKADGSTTVLKRTPVSPSTGMTAVGATSGALAYTTNFTVSSATLTWVTGWTVGETVTVTYRYSPTVAQARDLFGDTIPGKVLPGNVTGTNTIIEKGDVYTTFFDTGVNWATATGIKSIANGYFSNQAATGGTVRGYVLALPTVDCPFLGLRLV